MLREVLSLLVGRMENWKGLGRAAVCSMTPKVKTKKISSPAGFEPTPPKGLPGI